MRLTCQLIFSRFTVREPFAVFSEPVCWHTAEFYEKDNSRDLCCTEHGWQCGRLIRGISLLQTTSGLRTLNVRPRSAARFANDRTRRDGTFGQGGRFWSDCLLAGRCLSET